MLVSVVLYAISAVYFAGVMVRLMLTLTPIVVVLSSIAFSKLFNSYLKDDEQEKGQESSNDEGNESDSNGDKKDSKTMYDKAGKIRKMKHEQAVKTPEQLGAIKSIVVIVLLMLLMMFAVHCTWVTSNAYSSPSIVLAYHTNDG